MISKWRLFAPILAFLLPLIGAAHAQTRPGNPMQKSGKYLVELRLPAGGLFAEEETDVEFRVTDSSQDDPVQGAPPVVNARIAANVTMPSMPAMPAQKPKTHSEGVPGDYGVILYFPHGGEFQLVLTVTPPADKPFDVTFKIPVSDALPPGRRPSKPVPYTLEVKTTPSQPRAGEPVDISLIVRSRDTKQTVTEFETVHERLIHLIVVSRDHSQFSHEHPELGTDGKFTLKYTFPTGGDYRLFADTAPRGAGSVVIAQTIKVAGPPPAQVNVIQPAAKVVADGIAVTIPNAAITSGRTLPMTFTLSEDIGGKPVKDIQPWLGAVAHLILIHEDGTVFVHSHPDESDPNNGKDGRITFLARFPKPGAYRGWLQFQRQGAVRTAAFAVAAGGKDSIPSLSSANAVPAKFTCMHCGLRVTIANQADWQKRCPACKCGKPAIECRKT